MGPAQSAKRPRFLFRSSEPCNPRRPNRMYNSSLTKRDGLFEIHGSTFCFDIFVFALHWLCPLELKVVVHLRPRSPARPVMARHKRNERRRAHFSDSIRARCCAKHSPCRQRLPRSENYAPWNQPMRNDSQDRFLCRIAKVADSLS